MVAGLAVRAWSSLGLVVSLADDSAGHHPVRLQSPARNGLGCIMTSAASGLFPLVLPGDRRTEIRCGESDLSITGTLRATRGVWEPHVQAYLERTIAPDWVCLDIGANVGIHTLNLATVAKNGEVFAFEADPQNYAWLAETV
jgi:hypothetical protein